MKKNLFIRVLSTIMVLVLMMQMVPLQILAAEETTSSLKTSSARTEDVQVVEEITEKRTEYTKQFRLSNGLHMAVVYPDAVHYEENGQWKEIDNTLTLSGEAYVNREGVWQVSLPQQMGAKAPVSITKDGYTLRFRMTGEVRKSNLMSSQMEEAVLQSDATVQAQVATMDLSQAKQEAEYPETVLEKLQSRISYSDVFPGTDIVYDLQSNTLKESVVMNAYDSSLSGYRYILETGSLIPVLTESNMIELYGADKSEPVMVMPAPYMLDSNNEYCHEVAVALTGENGIYTLTYMLPSQWLAEQSRAWPVILDPVVATRPASNNIRDITVHEKNYVPGHLGGVLECGISKKFGLARAYMKYVDLPDLTSSDVIVSAELRMYKVGTSSAATLVEIHQVTESWDSTTVTWAAQPDYEDNAADFANVRVDGFHYWNITDIVQSWYQNGNNGLAITMPKALEEAAYVSDQRKQFWSSDYDRYQIEEKPTVTIYFRNNNGLEEYWNYTSASAGRAGTGYVNTYTGNLVWTRGDIGFGGNRMPVSINHVYNLNDVITPDDQNNSNDSAGNTFGLGNGWRTDFNQLLYAWEINGLTHTYYVWEDADGTDHYFCEEDGVLVNEDDKEMTLTTNGTGTEKYCITGKYGGCTYFDEQGRLTKISNNQATKSHITVTYTTETGKQIDTVTDGVGRKYVYSYNEDGLLTRISYLGTGTETVHYVDFGYTGTDLTSVTDKDGKSSSYTYDAKSLLLTASDVDGYKLTYTYNTVPADEPWRPYRVQSVEESDGDAEGGLLTFAYSRNETVITDHEGNKNILQFNDYGHVICIQDDEGKAQFSQYAFNTERDKENNTDPTAKSHQLRVSSDLQYTVANLMTGNNLHTTGTWTATTGASAQGNTQQGYGDLASLSVTATAADSGMQSAVYTLQPGQTHTFSCYVRSDSAKVYVQAQSGENTVKSVAQSADGQWHRAQVSYTNDTDTVCNVTYSVLAQTAGTFCMDAVQLENAPTASRYNLIDNGDFRGALTSGQWTGTGLETGDGLAVMSNASAPQLDSNVLKLTGSHLAQKRMTQTVAVNGKLGDYYTLAGWAMGDSAPLESEDTNPREFAIQAVLVYTDGTQSAPFTARFNPDSANWQYAATGIIAEKDFTQVKVSLVYDYNVNTAYFDGIQLYMDGFGAKIEYDENGNVVSILSSMNQKDEYEYEDNDLTKEILSTGAELTYTYDDYHNVLTATTEEGLAYAFTYDDYGNNLTVSVSDGTNTISTSATYTADGNRMATATNSLGKITTYSYDENTNMLNWVQYPEDKENWDNGEDTRTYYTYDEMCRPERIYATTDTDLDMSVDYTYTDDYLTKVETPTTAYDFTYGDFGLRTSVKIGSRTLASYRYTDDRNFYLEGLDYSNGDSVNYTYDDKGRMLSATYEDGDTVAYAYDNSGRLATVTDSATGRTTTYTYDFADRTVKYTETGANYSHSVEYGYDETGKLLSQTEVINGTTHTTSYEYDDDNRVTSKTTDGITVEYTYDGLGRVTQQVTKNGDTTVKTETYTFNENSAQVSTYRTQAGSYDVTYTYTYDDNGNILTVYDGTNTTSYEYDSQNQLIRENNQASGFTRTWTYDNAGNILNRKQYAYTTEQPGSARSTYTYAYGDEDWGDLLTAYNGTAISYDNIGNPTVYRGMQFTWEHGRQLASAKYGSVTETYTYDTDGMRIGRTSGSNTYKYVYNGSQLVRMEYNSHVLEFTYDAQGTPATLTYNGAVYYYITNLQGDVVRLVSETGVVQAQYLYDAWGTCATFASKQVGQLNPLRYRGYVYDQETELYYLQSRYYDPAVGRFINEDSQLSTSRGILGINQFAYCLNNPINMVDSTGHAPGELFYTMSAAARDAAIYLGQLSFRDGYEYTSTIYEVKKTVTICTLQFTVPVISGNNIFEKIMSALFGERRTVIYECEVTLTMYSYTVAKTDRHPMKVEPDDHKDAVAIIHTHPRGSGAGITQFSPGDKLLAKQLGLIMYVYGPNGEVRRFNPRTETDILLFDNLPKSPNNFWQPNGYKGGT